jgi:hypothetical protein
LPALAWSSSSAGITCFFTASWSRSAPASARATTSHVAGRWGCAFELIFAGRVIVPPLPSAISAAPPGARTKKTTIMAAAPSTTTRPTTISPMASALGPFFGGVGPPGAGWPPGAPGGGP